MTSSLPHFPRIECDICLMKDGVHVKLKKIPKSEYFTTSGLMYAKYHCPRCDDKTTKRIARWHPLNYQTFSWICTKCQGDPEELERRYRGRIIEIDYRCPKCGNEWTIMIEWYM